MIWSRKQGLQKSCGPREKQILIHVKLVINPGRYQELSLVENPLESLYFSKKYVALIGDVISDTLL